jgi:muramidase (phage lysozyme)
MLNTLNPNVQAFLLYIQRAEGTAKYKNPYAVLFGGQEIKDLSQHPNKLIEKGRYKTTAAGAYQFLYRTWRGLGFRSFSPENQDLAAVKLISQQGALNDVVNGNFEAAIKKCAPIWASLPGSPYGQPTPYTMASSVQWIKGKFLAGVEMVKSTISKEKKKALIILLLCLAAFFLKLTFFNEKSKSII